MTASKPFKLDVALLVSDLALVPDRVRQLQEAGGDGVFSFEGPHNPFLPLTLAAEHSTLDVGTAVAIAFARTPMTVANLAWDLQSYSQGRFFLGLGSQIKPHVEARYSMPWGKPVTRMREFVAAYNAIFDCWLEGKKLDFRGDYYTHTLMPPLFNPGSLKWGRPPVYLGGVGPKMIRAAGEVADGLLVHPFHSESYLQQLLRPALEAGLSSSERTLGATDTASKSKTFSVAAQCLVVLGESEDELAGGLSFTRSQIAFYGSTPAYRPVLEAEGLGELQEELRSLTKQGRWGDMAGRISDDLLRRIAIVGSPKQVAATLRERYAGFADRVAIASPFPIEPRLLAALNDELRGA